MSARRKSMGSKVSMTACGILVLLIAGIIGGIGWHDGYWSNQQTAQQPNIKQPSRQEAQR